MRGLPSVPASRIAVIGRQNDQCALSSQTLIRASVAVMYSTAKKRALSTSDNPCCADSVRNVRFQVTAGFSAQYCAARVCSGVRTLSVAEPSVLTSSNSRAYFRLVSGSGPSDRNWDELGMKNGSTSLSQPFGSFTNIGSTGRHTPGPVPEGKPGAPNRPSSVRAAIIAAAAASPTAIPRFFERPSGIAARDDASCPSSAGCCAGTR